MNIHNSFIILSLFIVIHIDDFPHDKARGRMIELNPSSSCE